MFHHNLIVLLIYWAEASFIFWLQNSAFLENLRRLVGERIVVDLESARGVYLEKWSRSDALLFHFSQCYLIPNSIVEWRHITRSSNLRNIIEYRAYFFIDKVFTFIWLVKIIFMDWLFLFYVGLRLNVLAFGARLVKWTSQRFIITF